MNNVERHLRDIKLLLAVLAAIAATAGYLALQSISSDADRDADRGVQQLRDAQR